MFQIDSFMLITMVTIVTSQVSQRLDWESPTPKAHSGEGRPFVELYSG